MKNEENRNIDTLVLHCSDSDNPLHDNARTIEEWHHLRGFKKIGYHFFIRKDGTIEIGRDLKEIGAHCAAEGINHHSIGICLSGSHAFTREQFSSLKKLCRNLCDVFSLTSENIFGHNHFEKNKTCPNFDVLKFREVYDGKDGN